MSKEEDKSTNGKRVHSPARSSETGLKVLAKKAKLQYPTNFKSHFGFSQDEIDFIEKLIPGSEDDPPLFIFWDMDNLGTFLPKIAAYNGQLAPPFELPKAPTCKNVSLAIVDIWRAGIANIPPSVRAMCVPGSQYQENMLVSKASLQRASG
jgi:hypothetical protein